MGLRVLQEFCSSAVRAVRSRAAVSRSSVLAAGSCLSRAELAECHRDSPIIWSGCLNYARYVSTAYFRTPCSNLQVSKLPHSSSAAPLSTLTSSSSSLFPSSVRSIVEPRFRGDGRYLQQLNAFSMQQKRGVSKLKKYKMKAYSSYKERFKLMADGTYKRWRSGTRHNAHSKTAKQRRHLRKPSIAPLALAKVMKKLNFMG